LDAYYAFAVGQGFGDVDYPALRLKVRFGPTCGIALRGNPDFKIGADGHVEAGTEGGTAAAKIFAGGIFFEGDSTGVAAADL
jgi:hypothetical protein